MPSRLGLDLGIEQIRAFQDFDAARSKAFRRAIAATLTRRARRLLSVEDVLEAAGQQGRAYGGEQEIPVDRVVGTASAQAKSADFDPAFLPISSRLRDRWTRIYREMTEGDELPPIDVYKVGENYYVIDGHNRVSVSRTLGRPTIMARVIDVKTRAPLGKDVDPAALLRAAEYAQFLACTELDRVRPEARLDVSRLGRYDELLKQILGHQYFLGIERGHAVPLPQAAASWSLLHSISPRIATSSSPAAMRARRLFWLVTSVLSFSIADQQLTCSRRPGPSTIRQSVRITTSLSSGPGLPVWLPPCTRPRTACRRSSSTETSPGVRRRMRR